MITTADAGTVTNDTTFIGCGTAPDTSFAFNFVWHSPDGTQRKFPVQTSQDFGCLNDSPSGDAFAIDSSGYHMYVTNYTQAVVYAKDGTQVFPSVQDTNGNHFSSDTSGNIIDTLGRTVVKKSLNGNQIFYDVLNSQGTTSRFTITTKSIRVATGFIASQSGITDDQESITVVQSLSLPTGDVYTFNYDEAGTGTPPTVGYGMLQSISGPMSMSYSYKNFIDSFGVVNRWESDATYAVISCTPGPCQTASINGITHTFLMNGGAWDTQVSGGDVQIAKTYDLSQTCAGLMANCSGPVYVRPIQVRETRSLPSGFITSQTTYGYDSPQRGNINLIKEWGFFPGGSSAVAPIIPDRQIVAGYDTDPGRAAKNIINRPRTITLCAGSGADADCNGAGTKIAQTTNVYDSYGAYTCRGGGNGLLSVPGATNHDDTNFGTVNTIRGNLTSAQSWIGGTSFLTNTLSYDTTGNVIQTRDPAGNSSCFDYADNFFTDAATGAPAPFTAPQKTNAYLTSLTLPAGETAKFGYYFGTGQQAIQTDFNNKQTYQHFNDSLARLTQVVGPRGWQAFTHSPTLANGFPVSDIFTGVSDSQPSSNCTSCLHEQVTLDSNGHLFQSTLLSDPEGTDSVSTGFSYYGELISATRPSRVTGGQAKATNSYDVLHRLTQVQNPDNSTQRLVYGAAVAAADAGGAAGQLCAPGTYGYGYPVLTINEVGIKKQVWHDAFGRIIEADEPDATGALTTPTCYKYATNDVLTRVVQGTLPDRTYEYDQLSRLIRMTTPEAQPITYAYVKDDGTLCSGDPGNVCKRVDGRGIITTYTYDADNRLIRKTYSDGTPMVVINYSRAFADPGTNLGSPLATINTIGRPSSIFTYDATGKPITGEIFSYDAEGNIIDNSQCTPQNCALGAGLQPFQNNYTYDLMGNLTGFSNDWGRNVTQQINNAGQVTSVTTSASDPTHPAAILSNAKYNASGDLTSATLGNGLEVAADYSSARGWLETTRVGSPAIFDPTGGNTASPGQATITIGGSLKTISNGSIPGTAALIISGNERGVNNTSAQPGTGTLVINGSEHVKQLVNVPAVPGSGTITLSGSAQAKQIPVAAVPSTGSFAVSGTLQSKPGAAGTASVTLSGSEQSNPATPAVAATASLTITGAEGSVTVPGVGFYCALFLSDGGCADWEYDPGTTTFDWGTVTINVNGHADSVSYASASTAANIASALASNINADAGAFVNATSANGVLSLTARQTGTVGNSYAWSLSTSSSDPTDFGSAGSFGGSPASGTMSGGANAVSQVNDSGTCSVTISGTPWSTSFGSGDTTASIASRLTTSINGGTLVAASASGATVSLTAKQTGSSTNYPFTATCSYNSSAFGHPSFTATTSGSTFTGGAPSTTDTGTVTVTINSSFSGSACFGPSGRCAAVAGCPTGDSTPAQIACILASTNNPNGLNRTGTNVQATWLGGASTVVTLTSTSAASSSNYPVSSTTSYDSIDFPAPSFAATPSGGGTMAGGMDATTRTVYDAGKFSVTVGGYTASESYGAGAGSKLWISQDLSSLTGASGGNRPPMAGILGGPNASLHLFYLDNIGHVHEQLTDSTGTWRDQDNTAAASAPSAAGSQLASFVTSSSTEHLFYVSGTHIHELFSDSTGHWHDLDNTTAATGPAAASGTALASFVGLSTSPEHVFYLDPNGHVHELYVDASGVWHDRDTTLASGAPTAISGSSLTAFSWFNSSFQEHVFYFDANRHVHELYSDLNGGWHDRDNTALTGAPAATTGSALTGFLDATSNGRPHVYYVGSDLHIHHLWMDTAGWHQEDLMTLAALPSLQNLTNGGSVSTLNSFLSPDATATQNIFYIDNGLHVHHLWNDAAGWHDEDASQLAGLQALALSFGAPEMWTAFFNGGGISIMFQGNDGHTYHIASGNSTAGMLATAMVNDLNAGLNAAASSVTAAVSGNKIVLQSRLKGTATNYAVSTSSIFDTSNFLQPSVTCSPCTSALVGGVDEVAIPMYDSGTLAVTINNHTNFVDWGEGATAQSVASAIAGNVNQDPLASVTAAASSNVVQFRAKTSGANTNYSFAAQIIHDSTDFSQPSFTAQPATPTTLQGGSDATGLGFDTGTITVTINGHAISIPYGQGDTSTVPNFVGNAFVPGTLYFRLVDSINSDPLSPVWASVCCQSLGSWTTPIVVSLGAKKTGASSNYPISIISVTNNSNQTGTSFPVVLQNTCGGASTLCNGADATTGINTDSGLISFSVGSFTGSFDYGPSTLNVPADAPGIAAALAAKINQAANAPVIAAASGAQVTFLAKNGGSATNYPFSITAQSDDAAHFPMGSFAFTPGSGSLAGGAPQPNPLASSSSIAAIAFNGTLVSSNSAFACDTLNPNFQASALQLLVNEQLFGICVSSTSTFGAQPVVSVLTQAINSTPNSPVFATASGNVVLLQSVIGGTTSNYLVAPITVPNGITVTASGPTMSGGTDGSANSVYSLDVGTDPSGTVFNSNDSANGNWTYSYDKLNRLQQALTPSGGYTYDYDIYGNRLHQTPVAGGNALSLVYLNNQIAAAGITYDAAGNMTSDGNHQYTYDAENRLIAVDGGATASYVYNGNGLRVRTTVGSVFNDFIHDPSGETIGVVGANRALIRQEFGGLATYSDAAYFHHRDWLGNLRVITDNTGAVRQTCTSLPFGDGLTCTGSAITPTHFTGYMRDPESGLDFANARYFTSQFGRFMSLDPLSGNIGNPQSLNRYAYALNNPLNIIDPSGMDNCVIIEGGGSSSGPCPGSGGSGGGGGIGISGGPFGGGDGGGGIGGGIGLCLFIACPGFGGGGASLPGPPSAGQIASEGSFMGSPQAGMGSEDEYGAYRRAVLAAGDVPLGRLGFGVIHQQHRTWNSAYNWGQVAFWGTAGVVAAPFVVEGAIAAPGIATNLAARGMGWYYAYAGSGVGVVLGKYREYLDAAESMGARALSASPRVFNFFNNAGEWWTLNRAYLNAQIFRGEQFYLSNVPLGQMGSGFGMELEYLISRGIGPGQWQYVPLRYMGY